MLAVKGNRVYQVDKVTKNAYLKDGFTITDDAGKVQQQPTNKTIPWAEHVKLVETHEALQVEFETLAKEHEALKAEHVKLVETHEALTKKKA